MSKKKYKNIKLEQNELQSTAIGEFENRKKSSIGIFIILAMFSLAIIYLPEISSYVTKCLNQYLHPEITPTTPTTPNQPVEEEPTEENYSDTFYELDDTLVIKRDDVSVNEFAVNLDNNTITYTITNNLDEYLNIESLNYFLELYASDKTLLERVKFASSLTLAAGAFQTINKNISDETSNAVAYVVLLKKNTSDYPVVTLNANGADEATLTCTRVNEKATYEFKKSLLKKVTHEYSVENTEELEDYEEIYNTAKNYVNKYNNQVGISSVLFDYENGFNTLTTIDLEDATRTYIFNADTFKLDTEASVVKFEMEAQNFSCE